MKSAKLRIETISGDSPIENLGVTAIPSVKPKNRKPDPGFDPIECAGHRHGLSYFPTFLFVHNMYYQTRSIAQ
jgi:hypothetical protein